jgi:PadR family transcriptional regulator PadR
MEMCILHSVSQNDLYGYDVMKLMRAHFPDVNEATFYAILRRLHKEKALDSYIGETSNGPPRKYYKITEQGRALLKTAIGNWRDMTRAVNAILSNSPQEY